MGLEKVIEEGDVHYEQTLVYDGTNQNVLYTFKDPTTEVEREDPVAVSDGISITISGDVDCKIYGQYVSTLVSLSGDKASNYDFTTYAGHQVKWNIDRRIVYAVAKSDWKMYDGTPLTLEDKVDKDEKYSVVGIAAGDEGYFDISIHGSGTEHGIYTNEIRCDITNNTVAACYEVIKINGTLIVTNSAYDISWISSEVSKR